MDEPKSGKPVFNKLDSLKVLPINTSVQLIVERMKVNALPHFFIRAFHPLATSSSFFVMIRNEGEYGGTEHWQHLFLS